MTLTSPLLITPSLLPGVRIGDTHETAWVEIDSPKKGEEGSVIQIWLPGAAEPIRSDRFHPKTSDMRKVMECALSFLGACGESYAYRMRTKETEPDEDSNETLFPAPVPEWAYRFSDAIQMLQLELEETEEG